MLITSPRRLQTMIRAMEEVVIPAMDSGQPLAAEQANLVVMHMKVLQGQADNEFRFQLAELRHFKALVEALKSIVPLQDGDPGDPGDPGDLKARIETLLEMASPSESAGLPIPSQVCALIDELRQASEELLRLALESRDAKLSDAAALKVLEYAEIQIQRDRVFAGPAGFDFGLDSLPGADDLV